MRNFVQPGDVLTFTAAADISAGGGVFQGALFGVAATDAANGADFEAWVAGVFDLPKASGALTTGQKVYWIAASANVTGTASGNTLIGVATEAAASGDTTARVRLNGIV